MPLGDSYVKKMVAKGLQLKQETILAVLITALVTAGAYFDIPPFSTVATSRWQVKAYWDRQSAAEVQSEPTADDGDYECPGQPPES